MNKTSKLRAIIAALLLGGIGASGAGATPVMDGNGFKSGLVAERSAIVRAGYYGHYGHYRGHYGRHYGHYGHNYRHYGYYPHYYRRHYYRPYYRGYYNSPYYSYYPYCNPY